MIDLEQYKGAFPWVDAIIKELEETRGLNKKMLEAISKIKTLSAYAGRPKNETEWRIWIGKKSLDIAEETLEQLKEKICYITN